MNIQEIDWVLVLSAAFATIGAIEWVKGFFPLAHRYWWRAAMPFVCLAMALVMSYFPAWAKMGILSLSLIQIAYQNIIEVIKAKVDKI